MEKPKDRKELIKFFQNKAVDLRKKVIKLMVIAGGGHVGGALSMMDILVVLYYHILKIDPKNPKMPDRDRFVLSKGHGAIGICPVLADVGFFDDKLLSNFNQLDSPFGMHPDMHKVPGIEISTGSLGHGLPICIGMALAANLDNAQYRVFCLLGDGECNEGSVWEAVMSASHYKLGRLIAIVDRNQFCIDGPTEKIMQIEPFIEKWKSFGWRTIEVDGHNYEKMLDVFENLPPIDDPIPTVIIANTIKGKGVSFMEGQGGWHYGGIDSEKAKIAEEDLEKQRL